MSLKAKGPQDEYLVDSTQETLFEQPIRQHTDFSIDQISVPFGNNPYPGTLQRFELDPKTFGGDLISNMHLAIKLPKLDVGETYSQNIGRVLVKSITLSLNEQIVQQITSDWLVIHDQIFLDDDEKRGLADIVNGGFDIDTDEFKTNYSRNPRELGVIIPLEFFFCRRHSPYRRARDRTTRPFFPMCAVTKQKLYITIEFNTQTYFTNSKRKSIDFVNQAKLIVETITLRQEERLKYTEEAFNVIINDVYKEPQTQISTDTNKFNITVNFPVALSAWFFRRKIYEQDDIELFDSHYNLGYTFTENVLYKTIDPFEFMTLFINNFEFTPKIEGRMFYKFLQPINYNLSTPVKEIYMYCYGATPKEYNTGGTFDFSKVESKSTYINYKLNPDVATDITANYTFNMYHYGYNVLRFADGYASLLFL